MVNVLGIGGLFFRARDPDALGKWYQTHLGVEYDNFVWQQQAGPTVHRPFPEDSDYFAQDKAFMINFRVADLDALCADLTAAGIDVQTDPSWNTAEYGRFARIHDPEGTPIELWEPPTG